MIARFCFHDNLFVAGNCRACLLEISSMEKPVAACVTDLEHNLKVWSGEPFALKAKENVFELLLANHPLDCPVCDQAGECDLQDQTEAFASTFSRYFFAKRSVVDKNCGQFIKTIMTRCIQCTRCVRFTSLIDGPKLGILNRGGASAIGLYANNAGEANFLSNAVDLCPVGALTHRLYAFRARPWETKNYEYIDLTNAIGANIYVNIKGSELLRVMPKPHKFINGNLISDKCRYSRNFMFQNRLKKVRGLIGQTKKYKNFSWARFFGALTEYYFLANPSEVTQPIHLLVSGEVELALLKYLKGLSNFFSNEIKIFCTNAHSSRGLVPS